MNQPSISDHYGDDHDRLDELFQRFQTLKDSDREAAMRAFQEFHFGLERHIVWEEEILFPTFERKTGMTEGPTRVMRWEHEQIRGFLGAMAAKLAAGDDQTGDHEAGLLAVLGPHNEKEEGILYPMIDQVTDGDARTEIFAEMEKRN
jgi:hemerythrin-like domain-containing protein